MSIRRICEICDAELPGQATGRPRQYCSVRCKVAAKRWAAVGRVIERARAEGRVQFAEEREEWLAEVRSDARHGWAGLTAKVDEINRRIREWNG